MKAEHGSPTQKVKKPIKSVREKIQEGKTSATTVAFVPDAQANDAQMFLSSSKSQKGKETMNKTAEVCVTAMSS